MSKHLYIVHLRIYLYLIYYNPFNINCSGIFGDNFGYQDFIKSLENIKEYEIPVYCFHSFHGYGIPDAPETDISIETFEQCMKYLTDHNFQGIPMRDIAEIK